MKKFYVEPELELINVSLLSDVLGLSQPLDEDENPDYDGGDFDPDAGFD